MIARAQRLGERLGESLAALAGRHRRVRNLRGLGLLWAFDLHEDDGRPVDAGRMRALAAALRRRRLHLHKRDHMVFLAPPLVIDEDDLAEGLARLDGAVAEAFAEAGAP